MRRGRDDKKVNNNTDGDCYKYLRYKWWRDFLLRLDILGNNLDSLDLKITQYANNNLKEIIRMLIDYLEDDNGSDMSDIMPTNTNCISIADWTKMVYELYNMVCSRVLRDYIKPKYQYLLFEILHWWQECFEEDFELLPVELEDNLSDEIREKYSSENGESYVLKAITSFDEYYYIFFPDHDFLQDELSKMVIIYLRSKEVFSTFFPDVDLEEYHDLMPADLMELYDEEKEIPDCDKAENIEEKLYKDIIFCCEKVQADYTLRNALENTINDKIRDLLEGRGYDTKDQTRRGTSAEGKDAGAIDILIKQKRFPITLIEALRLKSVDKSYIQDHIDKIYKYDTLGMKFNFLISYVKTKDFNGFYKRYNIFVSNTKYPYKLDKILERPECQYSEIRTIEMLLDREGIETKLYHILIHLQG